ncbi:uncharacterized protein LOC132903102 [Amyelois transitella]|uniref:uncharacterized protein LOC132903102 n=1 Tax=Amyelois transitella TaxID=680683 RepID=UPI0029906627|nr:uncharacterized protein LOC132903102 [Amyelois transitella]
MPTDVMSATCRAEHFGRSLKQTSNAEVKSGFLVLLGTRGMRQDVRVVVYRTSLEHFAVIYPRKRLSKPIAVISLRNTSSDREDSGIVVRQKGYDNTVMAKFHCSERDVESWLSAFSSTSSPHCHPHALPVLIEAEES